MFRLFSRAGRLLPACVLLLGILFSAAAEETGDFLSDDEPLFMEGEGITITASPDTTQQKKVVDKETIDRLQAPDLAVLLQETLGLGITRYGPYGNQTSINMRGFDSDRIAFLIDGIPANSPMSGELDLSMIDLNAVDRIEVIYGGSDSKYNVSGSLGGVINIITIKEQRQGLRLGGSFSNTSAMPGKYIDRSGQVEDPQWQDLFDAQNITLSAGYGAETYSLTANIFANRAENHFLFKDDNKKNRRKDNNEVRDTGASASFVLNLPDMAKFIVNGDIYYGDKNIPGSGFSAVKGKQKDFSTRQNIMFDAPLALRDDLSTEASLSHTWQTLNYEVTPPASHHDQHILTAINRWGWYPLSWLTLRFGGDYRFATLDSTDAGNRNQHDGGLYLTGEFNPAKKFMIIPSVKAVFNSNGASPAVAVPKLGFAWFATNDLTIRNNYFRSFKNPDFEDLYWPSQEGVAGNPDLKPEDGWGADLGGTYRYKIFSADAVIFTQWTDDSIHWAQEAGGIWRPSNVGEAVFFGFDGKISFDIPLPKGPFDKIIPSLSYQYMLSYLLSYGYDWSSEKRIPYMPTHTVGLSLDLPWNTGSRRAGSLLISGYFEGERYTDTRNTTKLDSHFLLDINVNQQITNNFTAFVVARNVLNRAYESFNDYPMPGITITAGLRINFEGLGQNTNRSYMEDTDL
jgi:vitamin B12 transporter